MRDYLGVQGNWDAKTKTLTLSKVKQNNVKIKAATVNVTVKNAEVDVQYPQVSGLASKEAEAAIDAILIGPGSLYTSILPNLLVPKLAEAVVEADAVKMFICNVMTQPGETDNYTVSDHLSFLLRCLIRY